jgi:hypothetical protein
MNEFKITYKPRLEQKLILWHTLRLEAVSLQRSHIVYLEGVGRAVDKNWKIFTQQTM